MWGVGGRGGVFLVYHDVLGLWRDSKKSRNSDLLLFQSGGNARGSNHDGFWPIGHFSILG